MPSAVELQLVVPIYTGPRRTIVAYRRADGTVPARDFLETIGTQAAGRYTLRFVTLSQEGRLRREQFHPLDDKRNREAAGLSEFKDIASKSRILAFDDGEFRILILTHGFDGKNEDDLDVREMKEAQRIASEYWTRKQQALAAQRPVAQGKKRR